MTRLARAALDILRLTFARETLDRVPASSGRAPRPPHRFLRLLFTIEPLPKDPPAARTRRHPSLAAFLGPEALPFDPELPPAPRRRGWLAALLAPESLPFDPAPPRRAHRPRRISALFRLERLDDSE